MVNITTHLSCGYPICKQKPITLFELRHGRFKFGIAERTSERRYVRNATETRWLSKGGACVDGVTPSHTLTLLFYACMRQNLHENATFGSQVRFVSNIPITHKYSYRTWTQDLRGCCVHNLFYIDPNFRPMDFWFECQRYLLRHLFLEIAFKFI